MCSADMAHGVHPNFADKHDGEHKPLMNKGPVIKTNVNMRYATNAETSARFKTACQVANVPVQEFINRTDLACGTTIGPISASQLAIPTVDVGNAMLSMHSIREQSGAKDVEWMGAAMKEFLQL
jgi:aspartyl aminopeptidase